MLEASSVAIAMSGGVDSSVAAALLQEEGLGVVGVTFRLFGCEIASPDNRGCCSQQDVADAMRVANALGIEHEVVDFSDQFARHIIGPFIEGYRRGETPNPCIPCNEHIKFDALVHWARSRGVDAVATGHHAKIKGQDGRWSLVKGADPAKDQSYFLFPLTQQTMPAVRLPVGRLTKPQVRDKAAELGLSVAEKRESQDICFAAGQFYTTFLEGYGGVAPKTGKIVLEDGSSLGGHQGLHRYTIGQRKGLEIAYRHPLYVVEKRVKTNELVVGPKAALARTVVTARDPIWTCGEAPGAGETVLARIRYRSPEQTAVVDEVSPSGFSISFVEPVYGVAPGQAVVLYRQDEVIGGGWIVS